MKLQCKICGSNKLINKGDFVICEECGCRYSIEDAKNLISDKSINEGNCTPDKTHKEEFSIRSNKKKHPVRTLIFSSCILAFIVLLLFTVPFPTVISDGYTYKKLSDGTYEVLTYTKNETIVEIPEKIRNTAVTKIQNNAFQNNDNIKTVIVPQTIETIGQRAFSGCTAIETMILPFVGGSNSSNNYLSYLFETSVPSSLKNVYLLNSCTKIGSGAFYECKNIENIYIPSTVMNIEDASNYTSIGVNGNLPEDNFKYAPFYGCSENLIIHCAAFQKPNSWGENWNFINKNYSVEVHWGVALQDNRILNSGSSSSPAIDHSIPKNITITTNNFQQYFSIKGEITPSEYSSNLLNPGYQRLNFTIQITPFDSSYIFNNIQVTISVNAKFRELYKGLFQNTSHPVEGKDKKIVELDSHGNCITTFTFYAADNFVIENIQDISGTFKIDSVYGELTPIK